MEDGGLEKTSSTPRSEKGDTWEGGEREGKEAVGISAGNSDVGYSGVDAEDAAGDSWRSTLLGDTEGEGDVFDFLLVCARRPFSWKSSSPPATR